MRYVCTRMYMPPTFSFFSFPRGYSFDLNIGLYCFNNRMWPTSIILSAAVILSAFSVSASNDPRECEGEIPMPTQISVFSKLSIGLS